jgi:putative glutamine amidotransferase
MTQTPRPVIGLNMDVIPQSKVSRAHLRLSITYSQAILQAGGLPVLMPPFEKEADLRAFLDRVNGFVLVGGMDLDPRRYGHSWHSAVRPIAEKRDESDRMLVKNLMQRQMPLLAIGLGMQQLNVAAGGTLYMHLPEEMPKALPHADPTCSGPHRHRVKLEPNSRLDDIYGDAELLVVSDHHQAVKQVGARFRVAATAPDGVIEAIEAVDPNWFAVGVQWHPESESASALEMQLFDGFLQASLEFANGLAMAA